MTTAHDQRLPAPQPQAAAGRAWVGWAMALLATFCFSIATPISRSLILDGTPPAVLVICRLGLAALVMGTVLSLRNPATLKFDRRSLMVVLAIGVIGAINNLAYNWSLTRLEASMAIMIFAINPLIALTFLWFGGERLTIRQLIRVTLALIGVYLLVGPGGTVDLWGALLVVISMLGWSAQMVGIQWYLRDKDAGAISFYIAVVSALLLSSWWTLVGGEWSIPGWQSWLAIAALAVIATTLARVTFFTAIQRIGSGQVALLMSLETILTVIWAMLFLGERITWIQAIGGALIITSALLALERWGRIRQAKVE